MRRVAAAYSVSPDDYVAIVHVGRVVASGPIDEVRTGRTLEQTFLDTVGAREVRLEQLDWLQTLAV